MLRFAALLRGTFTVRDLAVLLWRLPASKLAAVLQEAEAAGILAASGPDLAFRHPPIQQALYESMPAALRMALHAEAARELASTSADALSIAQQLFAAGRPGEDWARAWLIQAAPALVIRAPQLAAELLRRELDETPEGGQTWDALMASLVRALLATGSYQEAARQASRALTMMADPVRRAETYWMLARAQVSVGGNDDAITAIGQALAQVDMPGEWRARILAFLAMVQRAGTGDLDAADATDTYLRERWPAPLSHGVAALIAGRRDQRTTAAQQLRYGLALPVQVLTDRENQDFLTAAHALALEQSGKAHQAMLKLAAILPRRDGEMTLIHQWLPDLVRLALAADDRRMARTAVQACAAEAAAETQPARAAAASLRCRGLLEADLGLLRGAVAHYRAVGPAVELPAALEDLAAVLAERGSIDEARVAWDEAVSLHDGLQAHWDIRRADGRLRPYGIRRGVRGRRPQRAAFGWEALTSTEVKVAALVARGDSTSDIARGMFLSRRTVQTHISRILAKLGAKGRVEIVREALRQGVSA